MVDEALLVALRRLADDCVRDDERMTDAPWVFDDKEAEICAGCERVATGGSVGYENARMAIDDDDGAGIASARKRLPELARTLREAAGAYEHLRRLYADSRDYVATLVRERDDVVAFAQGHVDEEDRLKARVDQLESALSEALDIAEWEASEYQGKPEHLTRLPQLRAVLVTKDPQS